MPPITTEQLRDEFNDGDWISDPWFLKPDHEPLFERARLPRSERLLAIEGLKRVYPKSVCRELLADQQHAWLVYTLFQPATLLFGPIVPRLRLGRDVATVGLSASEGLLKRLHDRRHYNATAFELAVWANLKRSLYLVDREPRGPGNTSPDFAICFNHRRYVLELKDLDLAEQEYFAESINDVLGRVLSDLWCAHRVFTLRSSPEFQKRSMSPEGREAILEDLPQLVIAFLKKSQEVMRLGCAPDLYPVEPYGMIEVKEDAEFEQGAVEWELIPPPTARKRVMRIMSAIKSAVGQLPSSGLGVVIINAGYFTKINLLAEELKKSQRERPLKFANCAFIVVRIKGRDEHGNEIPILHAIPMQHHRLGNEEKEFIKVLLCRDSGEEPRRPTSRRTIRVGRIEGPGSGSMQITLTSGASRIIRP